MYDWIYRKRIPRRSPRCPRTPLASAPTTSSRRNALLVRRASDFCPRSTPANSTKCYANEVPIKRIIRGLLIEKWERLEAFLQMIFHCSASIHLYIRRFLLGDAYIWYMLLYMTYCSIYWAVGCVTIHIYMRLNCIILTHPARRILLCV